MDINFDEIYHFLFETVNGVIILMCLSLVICIIACVIMEFRTKRFLSARREMRESSEEESEGEESQDE